MDTLLRNLAVLMLVTICGTAIANPAQDPGQARLALDRSIAPIQSTESLDQYLRTATKDGSPLYLLSESARSTFIDSLQFGDNGVASFRYQEIQDELTPTEAYKLLSLIGFQSMVSKLSHSRIQTATDYQLLANPQPLDGIREGQCTGPATCKQLMGWFCHVASCQEP